MTQRWFGPVGWLLVLVCGGVAAAATEPPLCTQTSRAALRACEHEGRDEMWIAIGGCANRPDPAVRRVCRRQAKQQGREHAADCAEQLDARETLCDALGQSAYDPAIDPARFASPAAAAGNPNPYFPLLPGTTWTYAGDGETITVTVTARTKQIQGVTCTVVRDLVAKNGTPVEDTDDYFAQDLDGNVWYFGELSQSFEGGELAGLDGSWTAGRDGAKAGMVMKRTPVAGETYRQEFFLGDAEDAAEVVSVTASATVPAVSCAGTCVQTLDFTPLEADAREHKFYAPGVGLVLEVDVETGSRVELVDFRTAP